MNNTVKPDKETVARIFKAFCDPNRLSVLELLQAGEMCACKILEDLNIGQPTLSHHMKILCDSGIVISRQEGKWTHYQLSDAGREYAIELLKQLTTPDAEQENLCQRCGS